MFIWLVPWDCASLPGRLRIATLSEEEIRESTKALNSFVCELSPDRYNRFLFNKRYNALEKKRKVHYDYTFASDDNKEQLAKKLEQAEKELDYWSISWTC